MIVINKSDDSYIVATLTNTRRIMKHVPDSFLILHFIYAWQNIVSLVWWANIIDQICHYQRVIKMCTFIASNEAADYRIRKFIRTISRL